MQRYCIYKNNAYLCTRNQNGLHLGRLAEWLGTGLQNRLRRFESATDLKEISFKLISFVLLIHIIIRDKKSSIPQVRTLNTRGDNYNHIVNSWKRCSISPSILFILIKTSSLRTAQWKSCGRTSSDDIIRYNVSV